MIRKFTSWDEAKQAYGWTDYCPLARASKPFFEIRKDQTMATEQFVICGSTGGFRIFDTESDVFVANSEFGTIAQATDLQSELNKRGSKARAKHLDHVIDVLSGIGE